MQKEIRIGGLDFLRGIAIVLVIVRHGEIENLISRFGWLGVDLFFVLSGFLVSGLLFREYLKSGKVRIARFLIRRGFKIYPAFYALVLFAIVHNYYKTHAFYPWPEILSEVFYLQSYVPHIFQHTWSLAVEEHFYLGLALLISICIKKQLLQNKKLMVYSFITILLLTFILRLQISYPHRHATYFPFYATHLRLDGIVIGVFCSYLYYFTSFFARFLKWKFLFGGISLLLVLPGFIFEDGNFIMNTFGLTSVNIGFGILLLLAIRPIKSDSVFTLSFVRIPLSAIRFIGVHSYSIYLWHIVVKNLLLHFALDKQTFFFVYFILAIIAGIILSFSIERPFLRLRNRYFK